jgi:hypothetical protein
MFESLASCFAAYKPSLGGGNHLVYAASHFVTALAQFATGQIRRGASDLEFTVKPSLIGDTSKELDKNVVSRVILHGQCSLQRKEAR